MEERRSDMGVGLAVALSVLSGVGALGMLAVAVGLGQVAAAWGFAGAVAFGSLAVVAIHVYWG